MLTTTRPGLLLLYFAKIGRSDPCPQRVSFEFVPIPAQMRAICENLFQVGNFKTHQRGIDCRESILTRIFLLSSTIRASVEMGKATNTLF